jgi:predicted amidohydrolase YtcJ
MMWLRLCFPMIIAMSLGCRRDNDNLLLSNGVIYTVSDAFEVADAMVISGGKIMAVGNAARLREKYTLAQEIDLRGKFVFPGFIDPHGHFFGYAMNLRQADLTGTKSVEEVIARLKENRKAYPAAWILGRGWDQNDWEKKEFPDRYILDKAFPDIPVYLTRIDGHAAWVNSVALSLAGIKKPGQTIIGGEIPTDRRGYTGILLDNAMALVEKYIPVPGRGDQSLAIKAAEKNCLAVGLTLVGDAGLEKETVLLMDSLQQAGQMKLRIYAMLNPTPENQEYFLLKGLYRTDRLSVRSVKLFADGALGSRGALLISPYSDDPKNLGLQVSTTDFLVHTCKLAYDKGYQVNTHCIGDSAVRLMLEIYSRFLPENNDLRWRIEHSQVVQPDDLPWFSVYGIIPSVQATHATSDMYWAGDRLGPERLKTAYAYKTLLAQNGWLVNGSDFPVESINPIYGFYAAIARKDLNGNPPEGFMKEEALSRIEALRAMTIWAAKACFEENIKGSLEPGKLADFVVLDHDIMKVEESEIPKTRVLGTWMDGVPVFQVNKNEP